MKTLMLLCVACVACVVGVGTSDGESSPISERRAKVAAGPNAKAQLSLDLIPNAGAGNQQNDGVTSGTVSGAGTIAIEVFATGVTTALSGMQLRFDFDANLLTFVKAENSAFAFNLPRLPTGTDFAASSPVTLPPSGFLARAEFITKGDVTGRDFSIGLAFVTLSESVTSSDTLTTTSRLSFNTPKTTTPDFDGDGTVGFHDFLAFAGQYGAQRGDGRYQAKYDLNSNGEIDFLDFLTFASNYGESVPAAGRGGVSSSRPDLIVATVVSTSTLAAEQSFTLQATVRNRGTWQSTTTTLQYYQSSDATITTSDTEVGTVSVSGVSASGTTRTESISLTAPASTGTYYYGACVASVVGESDTDNNCSVAVSVTVGGGTPKMYWTDSNTKKIRRANLDGSNAQDLITTGLSSPVAIALDVGRGKMYWTDSNTQKIQRANLDGSNVEDLIPTGLRGIRGLALDVASGKMYWTETVPNKIRRANLDGSQAEELIDLMLLGGVNWGTWDIALDVGRGKMYWTDYVTNKIRRANLDGSNVDDLIELGLNRPFGIALDVTNEKMYWTNNSGRLIQRANLDGSNVEDLITTGLYEPRGIALDVGRGKMYWTHYYYNRRYSRYEGKIQRANLDGSNVEDLITIGNSSPWGIALDVSGR